MTRLKRIRQSPLWQTATSTERLTITIIGQVYVRSISIFGANHAAQTVGMKVSGPTIDKFRNSLPSLVCTKLLVSAFMNFTSKSSNLLM